MGKVSVLPKHSVVKPAIRMRRWRKNADLQGRPEEEEHPIAKFTKLQDASGMFKSRFMRNLSKGHIVAFLIATTSILGIIAVIRP